MAGMGGEINSISLAARGVAGMKAWNFFIEIGLHRCNRIFGLSDAWYFSYLTCS